MKDNTADTQPTVFLVDDDDAALDSLEWLLESNGFAFEAYSSAISFLDSFDPSKPGCVVLDLHMAEMDGLQLQDELASRGLHIPIIFVTGYGDVPSTARAMKAGAVDFLEKPMDPRELLDRVRTAIQRDVERRQAEGAAEQIRVRVDLLTDAERGVMDLLFAGRSVQQIAAASGISDQTAGTLRAQVLEKLDVESEAELARLLAGWEEKGGHEPGVG